MWNLKYDTSELIYKTDSDLWLPRRRAGGGGKDWEFGISRCKLVSSIGWMNNKVLLYSTGNYIQYAVINHNRKKTRKKKSSSDQRLQTTDLRIPTNPKQDLKKKKKKVLKTRDKADR